MPDYVLGLNCAYHESSVCVMKDGQVIAFMEEERLSRIKHAKPAHVNNPDELPNKAIKYCLDEAGISLKDIAHIGYTLNPRKRLEKNLDYKHLYKVTPKGFGTKEGEELFYQKNLNVEKKIKKLGFRGVFHYLDHHDCHAAGTYFSSGYSSSAVLIVDGIGEFESTTWYKGDGTRLEKIGSIDYPNSLGFLWEKFSKYFGFSEYDAAKVMGLTSYGNPAIYRKKFQKLVQVKSNGTFTIDDSIIQFRNENYAPLEKLFNLKRNKKIIRNVNKENQKYADLAASLQEVTEKALIRLSIAIRKQTGSRFLCMAGGVSLNCVANAKLIYKKIFDEIYIQPPANDAGGAIGAAYYIETQVLKHKHIIPLKDAYLGPFFTDNEILKVLKTSGLQYKKIKKIEKKTAQLLTEGNLVAWFQGRMEVGPRALGHRTILADPRNKTLLDLINDKVKLREPFRPLCPSMLEKETAKWVEVGKHLPDAAKYMLAAMHAKKGKDKIIPAVVHVDHTARIQTVNRKISPRFWNLINEFYKLTKVPVVMNTSFNIQEPIVCSPEDAIKTFKRSKIDYLVMGDYLCEKI